MALTKEDLQAIRAMMQEELQPIQGEQAAMQAKMDSGFAEMRKDFEKVHGDIGNLYENYDKQVKLLNENLPNAVARHEAVVELEAKTENHAHRISALEQKVSNG